MMKAVIFDMDGVLIDSEILYLEHEFYHLKQYRPSVKREDLFPTVGMSSKMFKKYFQERFNFDLESDEYKEYHQKVYGEFEINYSTILNPNVVETLTKLKQMNLKIALASSSDLNIIKKVLKDCYIEKYFDVICSGDMFVESKPNPEIYLTTCKKLEVNPSEAFIVEDSQIGLTAAIKAGATVCCKIENRFGFSQEGANYYINDLSEIVSIIAKQIKLVFLDNDGTLTDCKTHEIPESCLKALKQLKDNGVMLFLATGRTQAELSLMDNLDLSIFDGAILSNGVYSVYRNEIVSKHYFSPEQLLIIKDFLNKNNICCFFSDFKESFCNFVSKDLIKKQTIIGSPVPVVRDINDLEKQEILQICPLVNEQQEAELCELLGNVKTARWGDSIIDLIPIDSGKDVGVKDIVNHLELDLINTMSFGDGFNDIDMLKTTAISVAMGNGEQLVKDNASFTTTALDDDGVYNALKYFCLID